MTHDPWKGILLHALKEFASDYASLLQSDPESAHEQIQEVAQMFVEDHPSLEIKDLHDFQYDKEALFYRDLLSVLEQDDGLVGLDAMIASCGWIRRHGNPQSAITDLMPLAQDTGVPPTQRSTATYEIAQAYRKLCDNRKAIEWLRVSAAAAEEAGNRLQSLMSQATAAGWEAETNPHAADLTLHALRDEFYKLVKDDSPDRDTAQRWVMNTTYHLAKIAVKTGRRGMFQNCLNELEKPEYLERNWITNDQLAELRAVLK